MTLHRQIFRKFIRRFEKRMFLRKINSLTPNLKLHKRLWIKVLIQNENKFILLNLKIIKIKI